MNIFDIVFLSIAVFSLVFSVFYIFDLFDKAEPKTIAMNDDITNISRCDF